MWVRVRVRVCVCVCVFVRVRLCMCPQVTPDADCALAAAMHAGKVGITTDGDMLDSLTAKAAPGDAAASPSPLCLFDVFVKGKNVSCEPVTQADVHAWILSMITEHAQPGTPSDVVEGASTSPYFLVMAKCLSGADFIPGAAFRSMGWTVAVKVLTRPTTLQAFATWHEPYGFQRVVCRLSPSSALASLCVVLPTSCSACCSRAVVFGVG